MLLVDRLFGGTLSLKSQLREILGLIVEMVGNDIVHASMRLFNRESGMLERAVAYYQPKIKKKIERKREIPLKDTLAGQAIKTGQLFNIKDLAKHPDFKDDTRVTEMGLNSLLIVPLEVAGEVIGVVQLYSGRSRVFTKAQVNNAKMVSSQVARSIREAIVRVTLDDLEQEFLAENPSLDYLLELVVQRMSEVLRRRRISIWVPTGNGYTLAAGIDSDFPASHQTITIAKTDLPILAEVEKYPSSYIVLDVKKDERCRQTWSLARRVGIVDTMFIILRAGKKVLGIINVDRIARKGDTEPAFTMWEENYAVLFGQKAALAIHTAARIERAEETVKQTEGGLLAFAMSHSLLNPLSTLGLQAGVIVKSVENAMTFIKSVSEMATAEQGIAMFDPSLIIQESVSQAESLEVEVDSTSGLMVASNPYYIRLVIQGSLSAFLSQGKAEEPLTAHIHARREGSDYLITVRGPTISRNAVKRIFQPMNSKRKPDDAGKIFYQVTSQILATIALGTETEVEIRIEDFNPGKEVLTRK